MIEIQIDMDGVLARFDKEQNALERFENEKGFFARLEPTEFAKRIARIKNTERFYILTASPNEQADADKIEWLARNLPNIKKENIRIVRNGKDKAKFAGANSVLIDDFTDNLLEFQQAGGRVIKAMNPQTGQKGRSKNFQQVRVF